MTWSTGNFARCYFIQNTGFDALSPTRIKHNMRNRDFSEKANCLGVKSGPVFGKLLVLQLGHEEYTVGFSIIIQVFAKGAVKKKRLPLVLGEEHQRHIPKPHVFDGSPIVHDSK